MAGGGSAGAGGGGTDRRFGGYPSPYFDIASTYVPPSIKELFKWTRYFYYSNSVISPIIYKLSEYPITHLIYEDDKSTKKTREIYKQIMESTLRINRFLIESGLDYNTYGNSFVSILYPFKRFLVCSECDQKTSISKVPYKLKQPLKFTGQCPKCNQEAKFEIEDTKVKNRKEVRLVRWNPFDIEILHNDVTGQSVYYYRIPPKLKKALSKGVKHIVETTPKVFMEAASKNRDVELDQTNFFHFKRPNIADRDMAWGMPLVLPVIKDAFYSQVLRKGQEAIALDHLVPLRILFPSSNADSTPYNHLNLGSWKKRLEGEIDKWRQDPNYITIMPQPVGIENFGGDMQALRITPELEMTSQRIAGGMGVPLELLSGGMNWSGSSVSLRVLENSFLVYRSLIQDFFESFLLPRLKSYFSLPECKVRLADFKMADDIQKKQLVHQLKQMGDVSATTLLKEMGMEFEDELPRMEKEAQMRHSLNETMQNSAAEIQGRTGVIAARYQAEAQIESERATQMYEQKAVETDPNYQPPQQPQPGMMGQDGQPMQPGMEGQPPQPGAEGQPQPSPEGGANPGQAESAMQKTNPQAAEIAAKTYAQQILQYPPEQREQLLQRMGEEMPSMHTLVMRFIKELESAMKGQDMRPLPEQKAPRRTNSPV